MIKLIKPQGNKMKRVTISMPDSVHEKISKYSEDHGVSFSKACSHLSAIGITSKSSDDLSDLVMNCFHANNVHCYMTGNFNIPESVIKRSISHAISGVKEPGPLPEFAEIVGA